MARASFIEDLVAEQAARGVSLRSSALKSIIARMNAVRIETTVDEHGEVHLTELPFPAGELVEVTVIQKPVRPRVNRFPLRGVSIEYDRPTDPVAEKDWDALR